MSRIRKLLETEGYRFDFFQAIKLLEETCGARPHIGRLGPYSEEIVHIRPNDELSFSPSDVSRIELREDREGSPFWRVSENFLGLYGPNSAAPIFIAEMIAQCPHEEDPLRDFLDIFNHRILSLYYRAWKKNTLSANIASKYDDPISEVMFSLIGRDSQTSTDEWTILPHKLLRYANFFSSNNRPACGLESMLSEYFELDEVRVVQFVPKKFKPPTLEQSRLGGSGRLGESLVIGETIDDISGQFKIRLLSLEMNQFQEFQPGEKAYKELVFLTNLYTRYQLSFYLELVLKPGQGGPCVISAKAPKGSMGRSMWVGNPTEKETVVTLDVNYAG